MAIELGKPVRFLALEWREDWEFDHPAVLLEPVFRYRPDGTALDSLIEDAAIDIADDLEEGGQPAADMHPSDRREFGWRGWDVAELRRVAEAVMRGEAVRFGTGFVSVLEEWYAFRPGWEYAVEFGRVPAPAPAGGSTEVPL